MSKGFLIFLAFIVLMCTHQDSVYVQEIRKYQKTLNDEFLDEYRSPLGPADLKNFQGHDFFPINPAYAVKAVVERTPNSRPFQMTMNTGLTQLYKRLAILRFELKGQQMELEAYTRYQSFGLAIKTNPVLIPIIDNTTGKSTYDVGRYLTFSSIPKGDEWVLDFNKLYNPYCAYNDEIACPLVPEANHLNIAIEAGIKGPIN